MMAIVRDRNQLQFTLGYSQVPLNLSSKFDGPGPIIIERMGVSSTPTKRSVPPLQFTALSADNLSLAVDIARRDIKKLKQEEQQQQQQRSVSNARNGQQRGTVQAAVQSTRSGTVFTYVQETGSHDQPFRGRKPFTYSQAYQNKIKKFEQRPPFEVIVTKERPLSRAVQSDGTQTGGRTVTVRRDLTSLPRRSQSPPTRDEWSRQPSHDERVLAEIGRLRTEMTKCLYQIKSIEERRHSSDQHIPARDVRGADLFYAEDIEEERKARVRTEERATRMGREIYRLNQQTNNLQTDINRLGSTSDNQHFKKSQLTSRLSALHRGVIKALQLLVQQISDQKLMVGACATDNMTNSNQSGDGIARSYRALAIVIRQLSVCCARLEVTADAQATTDVNRLLDDMMALNNIVETTPDTPSSPPRLCRTPSPKQDVTRRGDVASSGKVVRLPPVENINFSGNGRVKFITKDRPDSGGRRTALVARLQTILKDGGPRTGPPQITQVDKKPSKKIAWHINESPRGVLIKRTKKNQALRNVRQLPGSIGQSTGDTGYLEQTVAVRIREEVTRSRSAEATPQPGTPRNLSQPTSPRDGSLTSSPRTRLCDHRSDRPISAPVMISQTTSGRDTTARHGIVRGVKSKFDAGRNVSNAHTAGKSTYERRYHSQPISPRQSPPQSPDRERSRSMSSSGSRTPSPLRLPQRIKGPQWIQSSSPGTLRSGASSYGQKVGGRQNEDNQIEARMEHSFDGARDASNMNDMSDVVVNDVIEDMARELHEQRLDNYATERAARMNMAPSVETVLQRLQLMEMEQNEIRRRWGTVIFEDQSQVDNGAMNSYSPRTPSPVSLARGQQYHPSTSRTVNLDHQNANSSPIMFTKTQQRGAVGDFAMGVVNSQASGERGRVALKLSDESLKSIEKGSEKFREHLKKQLNEMSGGFDPWKVVEEIADDVVEHCISSICQELEDINHDIVDHVYRSEFTMITPEAKSLLKF